MADEGFKRKLTSILSADAVGYSRLMEDDEEATVRTLTSYREVIATLIKQHNGMVIDSPGDNLIADFVSVVDAVQCAVSVQNEINARNENLPENRRMDFRIGINLGDVIQEEERIYGDGVNIAARLEGLATPGGICISKTAFDQIERKLPYGYEFIGDQTVKNISKPVGAYRVMLQPRVTVSGKPVDKKSAAIRRTPILVGAVAVIVVAVAVGIWQFYIRRPSVEPASVEKMAHPLPDKTSIVVLPFTNISDDSQQEYFGDGMTDDLITDLSKISGLLVISRNSSFTYKGQPVKIKQVAKELNVRYVLEGSVRKVGDKLRINAQLIDATTDHHLWAERYDGQVDDVFALQDKITRKIISALAVKLIGGEQEKLAHKGTENIAAYDAFLRGWSFYRQRTPIGYARAISEFKTAIKLDANYGRAYAVLALLYYHGPVSVKGSEWGSGPGSDVFAIIKARRYLELAMKNPTPFAHIAASYMELNRHHFEEAVSQAEQAMALEPSNTEVNLAMARVLVAVGQPKEAIDFVNRSMRLDPINTDASLRILGMARMCMGQFQEAVTILEKVRSLNPNNLGYLSGYAVAYGHLGRGEEGRKLIEHVYESGGYKFPDLKFIMAYYPFKRLKDADLFAEGFLKAGVQGKPSEYYKIFRENRLTGEEIKKVIHFGQDRAVRYHGKGGWTEHYTAEERVSIKHFSEGIARIKDDMICKLWDGLKDFNAWTCNEIYRNPEGTPELNNEYICVTDIGIWALSVRLKE